MITIHPTFTSNAAGGYDGLDARFAYAVSNAIPPGGDPTATSPGSLATAANVVGHVIAVTAFLRTRGTWQDAQPVAPFGGSCQGAMFSFSTPYLAGDAPPPVPPISVLRTPPFPTGADLVARVTRSWTVGDIETLPGSSPTSRTFVHIPTCAWMDSNVPVRPDPYHALTSVVVGGYTLFLLYEVTVTPGTVTWSWGDGTSTTAPRSRRARTRTTAELRPPKPALDRFLRGEPRLRPRLCGRDDHRDRDVHDHHHGQLERRRRDPHAAGGLRCDHRRRVSR